MGLNLFLKKNTEFWGISEVNDCTTRIDDSPGPTPFTTVVLKKMDSEKEQINTGKWKNR